MAFLVEIVLEIIMAERTTGTQGVKPTAEDFISTTSEVRGETDEDKIERIRSRAYEIWESEGSLDGHHEDHWRQAEHEIMNENGPLDGDDVPNLAALREAARQHTDTFLVASDLEDADQREATPGLREQS
ncbi:DUF2934 domain-containing protein [Rhizobium sp. NPDC090275]|uniref:DUF2934 domain-containing protein n=1 Tax=Rhizobium sp. NPDC090275 TaxID=3364498 RepID=UPI003839D897